MKLTNKQMTQEIKDMMTNMFRNKYLMPEGHSQRVQLSELPYEYHTYINERRDYGCIHIENGYVERFYVAYSIHSDSLDYSMTKEIVSLKTVYDYVVAVYKEVFSFNDESLTEAKRNIRKQIKEENEKLNKAKKEIKRLEEMLADVDNIK